MFIIECDGQIVGCSTLRVEGNIVLLGGMHVLAGFTDADIGLDDHKAILLLKGIHAIGIAMRYEPCFGLGIGEVNLQVVRLNILDSQLHEGHELFHRQVTHFIEQDFTQQGCKRFTRGGIVGAGFLCLLPGSER